MRFVNYSDIGGNISDYDQIGKMYALRFMSLFVFMLFLFLVLNCDSLFILLRFYIVSEKSRWSNYVGFDFDSSTTLIDKCRVRGRCKHVIWKVIYIFSVFLEVPPSKH